MPRLANMRGETGRIEIEVPGDEPLVVEYRRSAISPKLQARGIELQRLLAEDRTSEMTPEQALLLPDLLARTIVSWNLTDADGEVLPIEGDTLSELSFATLNLLMTSISAEMSADPTSGDGSSNGSSRTAVSELRPITTAS